YQPRIVNIFYCVIFDHDHASGAELSAVATFSKTRIFARRERGLFLISSSPGKITFFVSTRKFLSRASRWNSCFTMRSSSEWSQRRINAPADAKGAGGR